MQYLLDTNICIALMRNHPSVVEHVSATSPAACAISTITAYELYTGIEKCAQPARERSKVNLLLGAVRQLPFDSQAAIEAARIRALLESQGQMIGPYDVLMAGQARAAGLSVITDNTAEFTRVPGLLVQNWKAPPRI
jgi:tRNA(fMet)-specific endonuclease VapC